MCLRACRKRPSFFSLSLLFLLLLCMQQSVAARTADEDFRELEKVIQDELKETGTPGAAVAIVRDGRVVFARGFGVASVETNAPVTPDMLFRLGSTTKMFTGAALVTLAERGKLKLDAPIGGFAKSLAPKLARITPHQLLSNTAGVGDFSPPFVSHDDTALATMVRSWKDDALFAEPGKIYSYSSPGFWLAGYVLEEGTGKSYADAMDELIFQPLGMRRTTLRPLTAMTYPLAVGHAAQGTAGAPAIVRPAFNNVAQWPAGSIYSSANDLARFVIALLADGRLDGQQVLSSSLFKQLSGRHVAMPGEPDVNYGYGLLNFEQRGVRLVMHGGFSRGYGSMIQMAPAHRFAVIVLTNKSGMTLNKTTSKAKELFLPLKPAEALKPKGALPLTPADLSDFAGKYVNGPQVWEVYAKEGKLFLRYGESESALTKTAEKRLSFGETLENDLIMVAGDDGKTRYIFTGLYSAQKSLK